MYLIIPPYDVYKNMYILNTVCGLIDLCVCIINI